MYNISNISPIYLVYWRYILSFCHISDADLLPSTEAWLMRQLTTMFHGLVAGPNQAVHNNVLQLITMFRNRIDV